MRAREETDAGTLLLVEDDPDVRESLAELLEGQGYRVYRAVNGRDALRLLRGGPPPDAVIFDLMMPVMDGWQFRLEQRSDPRLTMVPVIALSADQSARAQAVDADAFLMKPVDTRMLLRTVSDLVWGGRARRAETERLAHTERLTTLGQLAAAVAHEMNNPLSWVVGNLRVVAQRLSNPHGTVDRVEDTRAAVTEALEGAERIQAIVSDIRVFTRKLEDDVAVVDVVEAVESVLRLLDHQIVGRVNIIRDWSAPLRVVASAGRLRQVLLNLVVNGLDALAEGHPEVAELRITLRPSDDRERIRIEIADTGCGIPEPMQAQIFEPFFTTKGAGRGTGLGLFVCRGLVTRMGGLLEVDSEVGKGARFWFDLPRAPEPLEGQVSLKPIAARRPRDLTVLVVDADASVHAALARQLEGHRVLSAHSALEALRTLDGGERVDLIFSDLYIASVGWRGLYHELSRRGSGLEGRMVFLTGGILDDEALQFARSRSDRLLRKPPEPQELAAMLDRFEPEVWPPTISEARQSA